MRESVWTMEWKSPQKVMQLQLKLMTCNGIERREEKKREEKMKKLIIIHTHSRRVFLTLSLSFSLVLVQKCMKMVRFVWILLFFSDYVYEWIFIHGTSNDIKEGKRPFLNHTVWYYRTELHKFKLRKKQ